MGRFRLGAVTGVLVAAIVIAFGAANCASPTQIIVDIRGDSTLCAKPLNVGVALTQADTEDAENHPLSIYQEGCETGSDRVGTLTITPSGSKDAKLSIRVVAGVNGTNPDLCGNPSWEGCILARRPLQFAPGKTVSLTIVLSSQCVGQICDVGGERLECNLGKCVKPANIENDGGNTPIQDGEAPYEDAHPPVDSAAPPDAGPDACASCTGASGATATCDGVAKTCAITCDGTSCKDQTLCGAGLDCTIDCSNDESCKNTRCATTGKCAFTCEGTGLPRCAGIRCRAASCDVKCEATDSTCSAVSMDGGTNTMSCIPAADGKPTCVDVECFGGVCTRTCDGGGCGGTSKCSGTCDGWQDGGTPDGG